MQNKFSLFKAAIRGNETLTERYMLPDIILSRLNTTPGQEAVILAITENDILIIISLYHSSIFVGYKSIIEIY